MLELKAQDTLTAVELNRGEGFRFALANGEVRELVLEETDARVLLTNCADTRVEEPDGGTIYGFTCRVRIDGRPMTLERTVCAQASFYEPYVVDGMLIWFDGVQDIFDLVAEHHGPCKPGRHARFAVQDASLPICPEPMQPWCPIDGDRIDVADCYNGDDPWMGPYLGASAHGGLDINHPRGTPLWAPIDLDGGAYRCHITRGAKNNRWWGFRHWPDGSTWVLGTAHLVRLLVPEHRPIKAGTQYAESAGVRVGSHDHTHFSFMVKQRGDVFRLDPWILFWQIFENNRRYGNPRSPMRQHIDCPTVVDMAPVGPARTGEPVEFRSRTRIGHKAKELAYWWTFGDGGCTAEPNPAHVFVEPGVYPVTLTVDDDRGRRAARTHHVTVAGEPADIPALSLESPDEPGFRPRPARMTDTYGERPALGHTVEFTAYTGGAHPPAGKTVLLGGVTAARAASGLGIADGAGPSREAGTLADDGERMWLNGLGIQLKLDGDGAALRLRPDAAALGPGVHRQVLRVGCDGLANSPAAFRVVVRVIDPPHLRTVTVGDRDRGFYATPGFWVEPRFNHWEPAGEGGRYLANGGRAADDEFARFTPALRAGRYEVWFSDRTPFAPDARFQVRVRHGGGEDIVWCEPARSPVIGAFDFDDGADGFVEVRTAGSTGQVLADAVTFRPI